MNNYKYQKYLYKLNHSTDKKKQMIYKHKLNMLTNGTLRNTMSGGGKYIDFWDKQTVNDKYNKLIINENRFKQNCSLSIQTYINNLKLDNKLLCTNGDIPNSITNFFFDNCFSIQKAQQTQQTQQTLYVIEIDKANKITDNIIKFIQIALSNKLMCVNKYVIPLHFEDYIVNIIAENTLNIYIKLLHLFMIYIGLQFEIYDQNIIQNIVSYFDETKINNVNNMNINNNIMDINNNNPQKRIKLLDIVKKDTTNDTKINVNLYYLTFYDFCYVLNKTQKYNTITYYCKFAMSVYPLIIVRIEYIKNLLQPQNGGKYVDIPLTIKHNLKFNFDKEQCNKQLRDYINEWNLNCQQVDDAYSDMSILNILFGEIESASFLTRITSSSDKFNFNDKMILYLTEKLNVFVDSINTEVCKEDLSNYTIPMHLKTKFDEINNNKQQIKYIDIFILYIIYIINQFTNVTQVANSPELRVLDVENYLNIYNDIISQNQIIWSQMFLLTQDDLFELINTYGAIMVNDKINNTDNKIVFFNEYIEKSITIYKEIKETQKKMK